jgi:hypothetical protein
MERVAEAGTSPNDNRFDRQAKRFLSKQKGRPLGHVIEISPSSLGPRFQFFSLE